MRMATEHKTKHYPKRSSRRSGWQLEHQGQEEVQCHLEVPPDHLSSIKIMIKMEDIFSYKTKANIAVLTLLITLLSPLYR